MERLFITSCDDIQKMWELHASPSSNLLVSVGKTVYFSIDRTGFDSVLFASQNYCEGQMGFYSR